MPTLTHHSEEQYYPQYFNSHRWEGFQGTLPIKPSFGKKELSYFVYALTFRIIAAPTPGDLYPNNEGTADFYVVQHDLSSRITLNRLLENSRKATYKLSSLLNTDSERTRCTHMMWKLKFPESKSVKDLLVQSQEGKELANTLTRFNELLKSSEISSFQIKDTRDEEWKLPRPVKEEEIKKAECLTEELLLKAKNSNLDKKDFEDLEEKLQTGLEWSSEEGLLFNRVLLRDEDLEENWETQSTLSEDDQDYLYRILYLLQCRKRIQLFIKKTYAQITNQ